MADRPILPPSRHQPNSSFGTSQTESTQFQSPASLSFQTPTKDNKDMRAGQTSSAMAAEPKKQLEISNLMSPPEAIPYDNFNSASSASGPRPMMQHTTLDEHRIGHPPLSPPISPVNKSNNNINSEPASNVPVKDPILYPSADATSSPPKPLFSAVDASFRSNAQRLVDEHLATRPAALFGRGTTPPQREEYELALFFKSAVMQKFMANPRSWLRKERELLAADRKALPTRSTSRLTPILPAKPAGARQQSIRNNTSRIQKQEKPKRPRQPKQPSRLAARAIPGPVRPTIRVSTTPDEPRVRVVAPNREDKDFDSLPDYSPPISSLPVKSNSLKVDWKGNPLDLSKDPNSWRLHSDEVSLAASLRLDCATYLTSKRRIFIRRLECARIGKEFRKTDAQQACKIDVNKASKLWTAFEKVGWLNNHWMEDYLKSV